MSSDVERLPRQDLLLKLLRMTTSPNDGEALVALRKATKLMDEAGWTWDKLIHSRITVMADPFAGLGVPSGPTREHNNAPRYTTPSAPPPPRSTYPLGIGTNQYEGACYCCGKLVAVGGGFWFKPNAHHSRAPAKNFTVCTTCNTTGTVGPSPAPRTGRGARKATADDLT